MVIETLPPRKGFHFPGRGDIILQTVTMRYGEKKIPEVACILKYLMKANINFILAMTRRKSER